MSTPTQNSSTDTRRDAAVGWLLGRINYERVAVLPYNERQLKLDRMRQLLTRLDTPDAQLRIVHVAGSKGKGSTAAMIAAMLTAAGHRTGVYSSPHLERIEERWSVDGRPLTADELITLVERLRPVVEAMDAEADRNADSVGPPTFFDITTAMALVHFARRGCDAAVLEVGLGGRLDSTNVCLPVVSVITSISLDHTRQLGDTLAAIAGEKAGIIKPGVPVVSGVADDEPRRVIAATARERGCRLIERRRDFGATGQTPFSFWRRDADGEATLDRLSLRLPGRRQRENAAVALAVVAELRDQGWRIPDEACRTGLADAWLPARMEWFDAVPTLRPAVVLDAAHNGASAEALVESLADAPAPSPRTRGGPRTLVVAISRDKQLEAIAAALAPHFDRVIATRYVENPRATGPERLAGLFRSAGAKRVEAAGDPESAWRAASEATPADGLIVVTGSFFIAAEMRPMIAPGAD